MNAASQRISTIDDTLNRLAKKEQRRSGVQRRYTLLEDMLDDQETRAGVFDDLLFDERQPATVIVSLADPELTPIWNDRSREVEVVLDDVDVHVEVDVAEEEEDDDEVTLVRAFPALVAATVEPPVTDSSHPTPSTVPAPPSVPPPAPSTPSFPPPAPVPSVPAMEDERLATTFRVSRTRSRAGLGIALLSSFIFGVLSTLVLTHAAYL